LGHHLLTHKVNREIEILTRSDSIEKRESGVPAGGRKDEELRRPITRHQKGTGYEERKASVDYHSGNFTSDRN
jgi:hypothetical protein